MELSEAQARVDAWIGQFEEGYWPPLANLARLTEEVGELARLLNDRFGPKKKKAGEPEQDLGEELADILFVLLVIANEQHEVAYGRFLQELGCTVFAGHHTELDEGVFARPLDVTSMSEAGLRSFTTQGAANVCRELLAL